MSMSRECHIVQYEPGKWYLIVANQEYGDIDYRDTTCVGPFAYERDADDYLSVYFTNPGGVTIYRQPGKIDEVDAYLIKNSCDRPITERNRW